MWFEYILSFFSARKRKRYLLLKYVDSFLASEENKDIQNIGKKKKFYFETSTEKVFKYKQHATILEKDIRITEYPFYYSYKTLRLHELEALVDALQKHRLGLKDVVDAYYNKLAEEEVFYSSL